MWTILLIMDISIYMDKNKIIYFKIILNLKQKNCILNFTKIIININYSKN